jgi:hypothetical protein
MDNIKLGDSIIAYNDRFHIQKVYTVKRVTKTQIVATLDTGLPTYLYRFRRTDGTLIDNDVYSTTRIIYVNGTSV